MKRSIRRLALVGVLALSCLVTMLTEPSFAQGVRKKSETVSLVVVQLNDIYEITPVENGKSGGLARVATILKQVRKRHKNVLVVLTGDFLSPSALGTAKVNGERLAGAQMVSVLNAIGVDLVTFGNHEFDVKERQLRSRIDESKFRWTSTNVFDKKGQAFKKVSPLERLTVRQGSNQFRVGLFGVTLQGKYPDWVQVAKPFPAANKAIAQLKKDTDFIIGLTHFEIEDDIRLANTANDVNLILGGHEHENVRLYRGRNFTPILKADANARSIYIHKIDFDVATKKARVQSHFQRITSQIPEDPKIKALVDGWVKRGFDAFRKQGFRPRDVVATTDVPMDGREGSVRNGPTHLTRLIAESFLLEAKGADLSIYNAGSIRVDDELPPGPLSQYDVIRILPFGGEIWTVKMTGKVLAQTLNAGLASKGVGGYLQCAKVSRKDKHWFIGGKKLNPSRSYSVAISAYLALGLEFGMDFLDHRKNPDITLVEKHRDMRQAFIDQLKKSFPKNKSKSKGKARLY
ncbi:MAG: bifunctional metallophosphatase/5'-nucleotidase [Planctomycetota bacterium]|nr:bifunctional metallophosphatase/5'-nucleotidase [Planctomycetota bacterium]